MIYLARPCSVAIALLLVANTPLFGQRGVTRDTVKLGDLVTTASRTATDVPLPAATTVLNGDDLRARGVVLLQDALREVPGMMVVQNGSYGALTSLFLRGGESDYVKVLLDGVPLNLPGGSLNLADLTVTDLDRIEVVRGPVSVLYGADAMSGVVQLFTRAGGARRSGSLGVRSGSFGTRAYQGAISGGDGTTALSVTGSRLTSNGTYDFNNRYTNQSGSARLDWRGASGARVGATAQLSDVEAGYPTDFSGAPVDHNQQTTERRSSVGVEASRPLARTVTGTLQGFTSRLHAGATNRPDTPADTLGYGFDSDRLATTWRRGGDLRVDWRGAQTTTFSVGTGIEREEIATESRTAQNYGTGTFEETGAFTTHRTTRNVLGQIVATPIRALTLQAGARLDDNSAFGTFGTWRAGASLQLAASTRVWAAVGTAFKAPTFAELFADDLFEVGNPSLLPERSRNVEVAVAQRLHQSVRVEVTAFDQSFQDLIQYLSAAPGEPTYVNLGAASSRGLELSVIGEPSPRMTVRGHWTLLDTEVTDSGSASSLTFQQGSHLLRRPTSSGGVTVALRRAGATLAGSLTYVGARDDVDYRDFPAGRTTLPSYHTVDLSLELPIRRKGVSNTGWSLTVRGENVFDTAFDQVVGFPGRGRAVMVGGQLYY